MANASGRAAAGFLGGGFTHALSGVTYRMEKDGGRVYLTFEREGRAAEPGAEADTSLKGRRELQYFLGSGRRGRTYLFEQNGYWFEIPMNWYAKKRVWEMAPNYQNVREMPLTLPVDPGCLHCHSSGAQRSLPEARNKYAGAPFLEGGITCTACHGNSAEHLASGGKVPMLRLNEQRPVERDSICLSCHLEGEGAVVHAGKRLAEFRPGESIFDYASYFVTSRRTGGGERATSQWEALLESGCKRGAGERLTCTSCHDPHGSAAAMRAEERAAYYRGKCLACHDAESAQRAGMAFASLRSAAPGFAAAHHPESQDCTACHMPRVRAEDIAHEQVTDHRIPRIAGGRVSAEGSAGGRTLVAIGAEPGVAGPSSSRDLGLAYAQLAMRGDRAAGERALDLLREASGTADAAGDAPLHEQLGLLEQLSGDKDAAAKEYGAALAADPHDSVAAGNLALLRLAEKQYAAAVGLWERAFEEDPVQLGAGMNLAIVECGIGRKEAAVGTLERMLEYSPDDGKARKLLAGIRSGHQACSAPAQK